MSSRVKAISIKMRKVNINGFFLYIPVGVIKGLYDPEKKFFQDEYAIEDYISVRDDYLSYSELECGYFYEMTLDEFKKTWQKENMPEEEAIYRYYNYYKTRPYITGFLDKDGEKKVEKVIDLDNIFNDNKVIKETTATISFNSLSDEKYKYILNLIDNIKPNTNTELIEKFYRAIAKPYQMYQGLNDALEEKLEQSGIRNAEVVIKELVDEEENSKEIEDKTDPIYQKIISKKEAEEYVKSIVINQDKNIERLTTEMLKLDFSEEDKTGILLTGSTGVGKTKIISLLAKKYDRPFLLIDTTQLSMPGYVGKNIEDFLFDLYEEEKGNMQRIEKAIVVFDEIDKKGSTSNYDVSGRGVLNTLLKFTDGTYYTLKNNKNIRTNNMTVIAAGAFSTVYKSPEAKKKHLGFGVEEKSIEDNITVDDFIQRGGMPDEFMGRFPVFVRLNDLEEKDLKEILLKSAESPLIIQKKLFKKLGVDLKIDSSYIDAVAKKAYLKKTGARSLSSIVEESNWQAFKEITEAYGTYSEVRLTKETVEDSAKYELIPKEEETVKKYELRKI